MIHSALIIDHIMSSIVYTMEPKCDENGWVLRSSGGFTVDTYCGPNSEYIKSMIIRNTRELPEEHMIVIHMCKPYHCGYSTPGFFIDVRYFTCKSDITTIGPPLYYPDHDIIRCLSTSPSCAMEFKKRIIREFANDFFENVYNVLYSHDALRDSHIFSREWRKGESFGKYRLTSTILDSLTRIHNESMSAVSSRISHGTNLGNSIMTLPFESVVKSRYYLTMEVKEHNGMSVAAFDVSLGEDVGQNVYAFEIHMYGQDAVRLELINTIVSHHYKDIFLERELIGCENSIICCYLTQSVIDSYTKLMNDFASR